MPGCRGPQLLPRSAVCWPLLGLGMQLASRQPRWPCCRDGAGERGSEACSAHFMVALVEQLAGAAKAGSLSEGQQQLLQDTLQVSPWSLVALCSTMLCLLVPRGTIDAP